MQRTDIIYALFRCFNGHVTLIISCHYVYRHKRLFYLLCLLSLMNSRQYNLYNNCFQSSVAEAEPGGAVPGTTRISRSVWTCLSCNFRTLQVSAMVRIYKRGTDRQCWPQALQEAINDTYTFVVTHNRHSLTK
jgi:hypothetical protein